MEWKKDNINSEKLKLMEKEYIEAALRMMKKAGVNSAHSPAEQKDEPEEIEIIISEEIHNENKETELMQTNENIAKEEKYEEKTNEDQTEEYTEEEISEAISDKVAEEDVYDEKGDDFKDADEVLEEQKDEQTEKEEQEETPKSGYGVYTADEILKGEGLMDAERIIEEIKMQNETMKKLTEEQEKAKKSQRTCPKCGKTIDGCT